MAIAMRQCDYLRLTAPTAVWGYRGQMLTLRDLVRQDVAFATITADECKLISRLLYRISDSWLLRWMIGREAKKNQLSIGMLAATLGRIKEEERYSLESEIRMAMQTELGEGDKPNA